MIDLIGDPARQILEYLDFESLIMASQVCQGWHAEIMLHRPLLLKHYKKVYLEINDYISQLKFSRFTIQEKLMPWSIFEKFARNCSTKELLFLTKSGKQLIDGNAITHQSLNHFIMRCQLMKLIPVSSKCYCQTCHTNDTNHYKDFMAGAKKYAKSTTAVVVKTNPPWVKKANNCKANCAADR